MDTEFERLRACAERELSVRPRQPSALADRVEAERELQIHQIELEMQNEELRGTLRELEASRARYRDLFELAPVGYVVQGADGISDANEAFARLLDLPRRDVVGKHLAAFVMPGQVETLRAHQRAVLAAGYHETVEVWLVARGGRLVAVRLESMPMSRASGTWRTAVVDVTEERRLGRQLVEAAQRDAQGPFARGVAHDCGHILMSVVARADLALLRAPRGEPVLEYFEDIKRVAIEGASAITRLLNQAGRGSGLPRATVLDAALSDLEPSLRRVAGQENQLALELRAGDARVPLLPAELSQILVNLVGNARDAMPGGGEVAITTRVDETGMVALGVADNGSGMDFETRARAFEPFFTTKPPGEGSGIGLSTVYGVVKQAGGRVDLRSELDQGTSVELVFPRVTLPGESVVGSRAVTVVVVDDDPLLRRSLRGSFERADYRVLAVASAEEALVALRADDGVHLLVTDFNLPGMSGAELIEAARETAPGLRTVMISGAPADELALPRRTRFLRKPFGVRALLDVAHEVLVAGEGSGLAGPEPG